MFCQILRCLWPTDHYIVVTYMFVAVAVDEFLFYLVILAVSARMYVFMYESFAIDSLRHQEAAQM